MKNKILFLINLFNMIGIYSAQQGDLNSIPDFNLEVQVSPKSKFRKTAERMSLHDAVETDDLEQVKKIFEQTGNIDELGLLNSTPLMYAVEFGKNIEIIKFLVNHGADMTRIDILGRDSIMIAIEQRALDVIVFLLSNLGDKNFEYNIYSQLINRLSLKSENREYQLEYKRMRYILDSYLNFKNEKQERLKKLSSEISRSIENMPRELTNIIANYAEASFEEYLGNSYKNFND